MQKTIDLIDRLWKVDDVLREYRYNDSETLRKEISSIINSIQSLQAGTVETYKGCDGWRFTLLGDNGEIIGSGESYVNKKDMLQTITKYFPTFKVTEKKKVK